MNKSILFIFLSVFIIASCSNDKSTFIIKTEFGDMRIKLYDETPLHRDNFKKLVKEGYYNGTLFHRVIKDFMIQGGDPDSRSAKPGERLGEGGPGYKIDAEFRYPKFFHKKGVIAAAREGDAVNPEKKSAGSQFYIVHGKILNDEQLNKIEQKMRNDKRSYIFNALITEYKDSLQHLQMEGEYDKFGELQKFISNKVNETYSKEPEFKIPDNVREVYKTIGGTPFLDGNYTVFGEIVEELTLWEKITSVFGKKYGLEVLDRIEKVKTDKNDRPIEDIKMTIKN